MNYLNLLFIILLIAVCECLSQSCLKKYKTDNKIIFYITAVILYSMICYLLVMSYKYKGMGIVNVLWSGISVLGVLSAGIIFFNEKITKMDWIGIVFIILGIFFVLYEGVHPVNKN